MSAAREKLIKQLLEAAFNELQHDTGPTEPEWVHSWNALKSRFTKILERKSDANEHPRH